MHQIRNSLPPYLKKIKFILKSMIYISIKDALYLAFLLYTNDSKNKQTLVSIKHKLLNEIIYLRKNSSDIDVFYQVLANLEYKNTMVSKKDSPVIIDIGANIGLTSVYLANIHPTAQVYAIEPEKTNFLMLKLNTNKYKNIKIFNQAISDSSKLMYMKVTQGKEWGARVTNDQDKNDLIKTTSLLDFLKKNNIGYIDILKIDVEGSEVDIFSNTKGWINKFDSLYIEFHERYVKNCTQFVLSKIDSKRFSIVKNKEHYAFTKKK